MIFNEIAIRSIVKIAVKRQDNPLKNQLNKYTEVFWDKVETPLGLAMSQVVETYRDWCARIQEFSSGGSSLSVYIYNCKLTV